MVPKANSWEHPWLVVERITRAIVGERFETGAADELDRVLAGLMRKRREVERAGWFN